MCKENISNFKCKDCKCIMIGVDAEFFLKNSEDSLISAIGKIKGTKKDKYILSTGAGLHHDNVSVEIAFLPFKSFEDWNSHIHNSIEEVKKIIYPYILSTDPSGFFPDEELQDERAWQFGCDPDFNAWTKDLNIMRDTVLKSLRTNGAHIHIGMKKLQENPQDAPMFIKNMDNSLGIYGNSMSDEVMRRILYGRAGAFRPKKYGVEYRVLSSWWVTSEEYRKEIWKRTIEVCVAYQSGIMSDNVNPDIEKLINYEV